MTVTIEQLSQLSERDLLSWKRTSKYKRQVDREITAKNESASGGKKRSLGRQIWSNAGKF